MASKAPLLTTARDLDHARAPSSPHDTALSDEVLRETRAWIAATQPAVHADHEGDAHVDGMKNLADLDGHDQRVELMATNIDPPIGDTPGSVYG